MDTRRECGGSRAQLIIITALVLATVFVALALVLNSGIYAENLSTRETTDSEAAIGYSQEAEATVADAYRIANDANASTAGAARGAFTDVADSWADARSSDAAQNGVSAKFDRTTHVGWHLRQDEDRSFTPANDSTNQSWQVAHDAQGVAAFQMNVTRENLYDAHADFDNTSDDAFYLRVENGSDSWLLYVFQDTGNGSIIVHDGDPNKHGNLDELRDSDDSCYEDQSWAVIDFQNESVAQSECSLLNFSDDVSGYVDIHYENPNSDGSEQINGTYTLVLNGTTAAGPRTDDKPANFNVTGGAAPTAQAVVYSASFATEYERSDIRYAQRNLYAVREETYAG